MRSIVVLAVPLFVSVLSSAHVRLAYAQENAKKTSAVQQSIELATGWALLKEGEAEGAVEQDAKHPTSSSPHLLHIAAMSTAAPGKGRIGATSGTAIDVHDGQWYDVTFSAVTERGSIGLVFSLEGKDGKVLARTTLPEIGRGGRGRAGTEAANTWRKYTVALRARASDRQAHLTIAPIEPTNVWLDGLTITVRSIAP
jgi:hypothetical protein